MQAIGEGGLSSKAFDVLYVLLVVGGEGHFETEVFAINVREQLSFLEDGWRHDVLKVGLAQSSVPVVDNVASVHDLTEDVDEILEGNL